MQSISEYYYVYDVAIRECELLVAKYKAQVAALDPEEADIYEFNYDDEIYKLEKAIESFRKQKFRYIFDKMSKEEFEKLLENAILGNPSKLIVVGMEHVIKDVDTLQRISYEYNIPVIELLSYNRISSEDFEDLKEIQGTILIPMQIDLSRRTIYTDLPVFGSQAGKNAWGKDWANEIIWHAENKDIETLTPDETLVQGILNGFGQRGDIPGHEDFTIEIVIGQEIPDDAYDAMIIAQLESKVLRDRRVRKIKNIQIERSAGARFIYLTIIPINSENPIEISTPRIPIAL